MIRCRQIWRRRLSTRRLPPAASGRTKTTNDILRLFLIHRLVSERCWRAPCWGPHHLWPEGSPHPLAEAGLVSLRQWRLYPNCRERIFMAVHERLDLGMVGADSQQHRVYPGALVYDLLETTEVT